MKQVIYADILIIVNTYVNYGLLRLCSVICRYDANRLRIALSAFSGGIYSLVILIPDMPFALNLFLKTVFAFLAVYIAFGFINRRRFLRSFAVFLVLNLIFAGLMVLLWTLFSPGKMYYNNCVVYFDISTFQLAVMTVICYAVVCFFNRVISSRAPDNTIYDIAVDTGERVFRARAFLDTGNSLCEPFSSFPVVVMNENLKAEGTGETLKAYFKNQNVPFRYIPCEGVSGSTALTAFRPKKIHIKGVGMSFDTDEVYVALTGTVIKGGDFDALLNIHLFEDRTVRKENIYAQKNNR